MSSGLPTEYDQLTPEEAARVDRACDRLESAWRAVPAGDMADSPPRVASFLDGPGRERDVLLRELVAIDRAYRARHGLEVPPEECGPLGEPTLSLPRSDDPDGEGTDRGDSWPTLPGLRLLDVLGIGGMGVVFRARQEALGRDVAVKLLRDAHLSTKEQRERFLVEAQAVARLRHPHLVQVYDFGEVRGTNGAATQPYLVLELVAGGSLVDLLKGTPLPPHDAASLVRTLALAIQHAHDQGVIHRDLKPGNILLQVPPGGCGAAEAKGLTPGVVQDAVDRLRAAVPKIGDFGLAKFQTDSDLTRTGDVLGTPSYMAPEQTTGKPLDITPSADVYGLGAILYEALTGRPPFRAETAAATIVQVQNDDPVPPRRLQPTVPRDLETISLKCLQKQPGLRYPTAQALADDLGRFLGGQSITARPTGMPERVRKWVRRRPAVAALLAAVVALTSAGLAGVVWQWRKTAAALDESRRAHEATRAHLYLNLIARARHELQANHVSRALRLLEEVPEPLGGWEWRYLKKQCQTSLFILRGNGTEVQSVAYGPDGKLLASGAGNWYSGRGGELVVWDARTGRRLRTLGTASGTVYAVAFHPDGRRLASAGLGGTVRIWDAHTGALLRDLKGHPSTSDCVAFSPDGKLIAAGCRQSGTNVLVWDAETGEIVHRMAGHRGPVWGVAFSPDGRRLASCDYDGIAHLWDRDTGAVVRTFGGFNDFRAVAFSPDGVWLALASYSGHVVRWDLTLPNSGFVDHHPNAGPLLSLAFTPNGSLAWSSRNGDIRIQDPIGGRDRYVIRGHEGWAYSVSISPDGRRIASGGTDGTVRISDATAFEDPPWVIEDGAELPGMMFDADGRLLALGGIRGQAVVWDVASGKRVFSERGPTSPSAMAGSPDGQSLAWIAGKTLRVRRRGAQADAWSRETGSEAATALAYSADSRRLAWGDDDGAIHVLDGATGAGVLTLPSDGSAAAGVAFHPGGESLAAVGRDGTFRIWSLETRQVVKRFGESGRDRSSPSDPAQVPDDRAASGATRLSFSPDGRRLAAANPGRPLEIWDVSSGRIAIILDWDAEGASSAAWSADGSRLAAAFGKRVKLWDATEQTIESRRRATEGDARAWHQNEARWGEIRWDWFAVIYHTTELIESEPSDASLEERRSHLDRRGRAHALQAEAGHGSWRDAAADFAECVRLDASDLTSWYRYALSTLAAGDRRRYREICADLLDRFGDSDRPAVLNQVAWTCSLGPDAVPDPSGVAALAGRAAGREPMEATYSDTLVLALCRAKRWGEAFRAQRKLAEARGAFDAATDLYQRFYLALIHRALGDAEESRRQLDQAVRLHDHVAVDQPAPGANGLIPWEQRAELRLLRQELLSEADRVVATPGGR
jgi:WD40 repeat protein/serine/threonine protein kinase